MLTLCSLLRPTVRYLSFVERAVSETDQQRLHTTQYFQTVPTVKTFKLRIARHSAASSDIRGDWASEILRADSTSPPAVHIGPAGVTNIIQQEWLLGSWPSHHLSQWDLLPCPPEWPEWSAATARDLKPTRRENCYIERFSFETQKPAKCIKIFWSIAVCFRCHTR